MQLKEKKAKKNLDILTHINALRTALRAEYEAEKDYFRQMQENRGLERLIRRGECYYPVVPCTMGHNALGQMTVELRTTPTEDSKFQPATPVCFFRVDEQGSVKYLKWNGSVSYEREDRLTIALPQDLALADLQGQDRLGVQLAFNERTYQLQFEALNKLEASVKKQGSLTKMAEVLIGGKKPKMRPSQNLRFPWLNQSQEDAVNSVVAADDVMIVHGPPGTGKTTTLLESIYETLRREPQVLVCAQSNAAVDWIASQLLDRAVPVLRIGNPTRVTDRMLSCTYEHQFADHPSYSELWNLRRTLREQKLKREAKDRLRERANALELEIRQELFNNAKVIACTLAGAGHPLMQGQQFHTLFIDEAAQATEPMCWVALRHARRVVMAGDHCQLPPTLMTREAARGPLGQTLMERVVKLHPEVVSLLTVQYRMHPDIMQFSSDFFYDGRLTAAESVRQRGPLDLDSALLWFDTQGQEWQEAEQTDGTSRYNWEEARFVVQQLEQYVEMMTVQRLQRERGDFGVISPYQAQIQLLRKLIKRSSVLRPLRGQITVQTVDAFQGQERDVIVLSLVRANADGQIGFLSDLRRMNVAITRARHKVIIIGDASTLTRHGFYRQLLEHIERVGRVVEVS